MTKTVFETNEKIRIELISGREIQGDLVHKDETSLILKNSEDLLHGKRYRHNQTFYLSEIKQYYSVSDEGAAKPSASEHLPNKGDTSKSETKTKTNSSDTSKPATDTIKKTFAVGEIERIQESMKKTVYISQFDDKYHDAINDVKAQKIVAVNSENHFGRLDPMRPLIAIDSGHRVYLFDMVRLGPMKKEFKAIFAAESPRKIVHRSPQFSDYLAHTENCTLTNVFDTLMVHFALKKSRECLSLQDCFKVYFDLPENSFDFTDQTFDFRVRPLKPDALLRSSLNVQLLSEMYWYFNDILMKPLRVATESFSSIYPSFANPVDLMSQMNNGAYPGVEKIDLNADKELEETFETLLIE